VQFEVNGGVTSRMVNNIPYSYTILDLEEEFASLGLQGLYDFIYLPGDSKKRPNLGYAFLNFKDNSGLNFFFDIMHKYRFKKSPNKFNKPARVSIASTQGFTANMMKYMTSREVGKQNWHQTGLFFSA